MSFQGWLMVFRQSHAVGAPNGGPGLTLLNWSLTGGDLRIAHLVGVASVLYGGLTAATLVLALLGTPLVSAPVAPWLSPSILAGVLLAVTVGGFVLGTALWKRGTTVY